MTRSQFVKHYAAVAEISEQRADDLVDLFTGLLTAAFHDGEDVILDGFGTFVLSSRAGHARRVSHIVPKGGGAVRVHKPRIILKFQTALKLRKSMRQWEIPSRFKMQEDDSL